MGRNAAEVQKSPLGLGPQRNLLQADSCTEKQTRHKARAGKPAGRMCRPQRRQELSWAVTLPTMQTDGARATQDLSWGPTSADSVDRNYWNMYITICEIDDQSKFDAWKRALKAGALGWLWGLGWGGRWGGFRMGDTCTPMADSCQCMAKTTTVL